MRTKTAFAWLAPIAATAIFSAATATTVQPVLLDLTTTGPSQSVSVTNTASAPLPVEIRTEVLSFDNQGVAAAAASRDLTVFPAQAVIAPGRTQSFRVQWAGGALQSGRSYYVTVAQAPVALPSGQSAIQVLYNFQVMVNVAPPGVEPDLRVDSAVIGRDGEGNPAPVITVSNASTAHGYISRGELTVVQRDTQGQTVLQQTLTPSELQQSIGFGLVPPGQKRIVTLPIALQSGDGAVEARFVPTRR